MFRLTSAVRYRADTEGNSSLHSLHLTSLSALLVSSLIGVSALLGGGRRFSFWGLWTRLQELTGKLAVMLEGHSCLFESHSPSHVSTDPAGNHIETTHHNHPHHRKGRFCKYTLMIPASVSSLLTAPPTLLLETGDPPGTLSALRDQTTMDRNCNKDSNSWFRHGWTRETSHC